MSTDSLLYKADHCCLSFSESYRFVVALSFSSLSCLGVLPYMGYIGMCGAKGYGLLVALVINSVSILAILPPSW